MFAWLSYELLAWLFRVPQENRGPQEELEIKALQVQSVFLVLMDLVVILVLM